MLTNIKKVLKNLEINYLNFSFVILLAVLVAFFDLLSLALIGPLVDISVNKDNALRYISFLQDFQIELSQNELMLYLPVFILFIFIVKFAFIFFANFTIYRFSELIRKNLRIRLMTYYLKMNYLDFLRLKLSTKLYNSTEAVGIVCTKLVFVSLRIISDSLVALLILTYLFLSYTQLFQVIFLIALLSSIFYFLIFGSRARVLGIRANELGERLTKVSLQMLEGFKELNVRNISNKFLSILDRSADSFAKTRTRSDLYSGMPKYYFELIFFGLFCGLIIFINLNAGYPSAELLGTVGVFAVALVRLLPISATILGSSMQFSFGLDAYNRIKKDLEDARNIQDINTNNPTKEFRDLKLRKINFSYDGGPQILKNIDLDITRGDFIVITGESGSGKSTLVEIICGLISPTSGKLIFNGSAYSKGDGFGFFSYSPQNTFVFDGSLKENIAFDDFQIDESAFYEILKITNLEKLYKKVGSKPLGDSGSMLSGGQKQRISLARGLASGRDIIIFDETTNALDAEMEKNVLKKLKAYVQKKSKTVIFISHGIVAPKYASKIIDLSNEKENSI